MLNSLDTVQLITFPAKGAEAACLHVFEAATGLPFEPHRVFTITAAEAARRGFHAHKSCQQLLVCLHGECTVEVDDGEQRCQYVLQDAETGLYIPSTLWAEQTYAPDTILMVMADQPYTESDYVRDYAEFQQLRRLQ